MLTNATRTRLFASAGALLLFVLPIPRTIGLRNSLTLILLILLGTLWHATASARATLAPRVKPLAGWLGALTAWIVLQAVLISDESTWALEEIFTQWTPALIAALFGSFLVALSDTAGWERRRLLTAFVAVLLSQTLFCLLTTFPEFIEAGYFPQGRTLWTAGKLEISFWNNLTLAFLSVDLLHRWRHRDALLAWPLAISALGTLLLLAANLAFGARNGIIGSIMLLLSLVLLVAWRERRNFGSGRAFAFALLACALVTGMVWGSLRLDARWTNFLETARFTWSESQREYWLRADEQPAPRLPSGATIDQSTHLRLSWIMGGIEVVTHTPLGVGYGRNAFGHALRKTENTRIGHSHSGIIDLAVGTGIPGIVLWSGLIVGLLWKGLQGYFRQNDPSGLIIALVSGGFMGRMVIDSVNRDHMLMLFFLTIGFLAANSLEPARTSTSPNPEEFRHDERNV